MAQPGSATAPGANSSTTKRPVTEVPVLESEKPFTPTLRIDSKSTLREDGSHDDATRHAATAACSTPQDLESVALPHWALNEAHGSIKPNQAVRSEPEKIWSLEDPSDALDGGRRTHQDVGFFSDSSGDSSGDEGKFSLRKSHSQPDHKPFSTSKLNRVYKHPARALTEHPKDKKRFKIESNHFTSLGKVARDGRLTISVNDTANSGYIAKALGATISSHLRPHAKSEVDVESKAKLQRLQSTGQLQVPRLNIVIMVIGSRGDVQPFLKIGKVLRDKNHHRVRIATHPTFRKFVEEDVGLEFFSVGGDPSELMAFMVKNPGLIPSLETIKAGEIGRRRESMYEMFQGFWRACINSTDDETDLGNLQMPGSRTPFIADAIIANPPSFAHFCCAERLGIPLHLVFTFPYTPTQSFPHPLANIKAGNVDVSYTNFMS